MTSFFRYKEGDCVLVEHKSGVRAGTIRYVGDTFFGTGGVWVGVELRDAVGGHDGARNGYRYFQTTSAHGAFVRPHQVLDFDPERSTTNAGATGATGRGRGRGGDGNDGSANVSGSNALGATQASGVGHQASKAEPSGTGDAISSADVGRLGVAPFAATSSSLSATAPTRLAQLKQPLPSQGAISGSSSARMSPAPPSATFSAAQATSHRDGLDQLRPTSSPGHLTAAWSISMGHRSQGSSRLLSTHSPLTLAVPTLSARRTPGAPAQPNAAAIKGLRNLGNTCFFNSVAQLLAHCSAVQRYFVCRNAPDSLLRRNLRDMPLVSAFRKFIFDMCDGKGGISDPGNLFSQICKKVPRFGGRRQQDSLEVLKYLLDNIHEETRRLSRRVGKNVNLSPGQLVVAARVEAATMMCDAAKERKAAQLEHETKQSDALTPIPHAAQPTALAAAAPAIEEQQQVLESQQLQQQLQTQHGHAVSAAGQTQTQPIVRNRARLVFVSDDDDDDEDNVNDDGGGDGGDSHSPIEAGESGMPSAGIGSTIVSASGELTSEAELEVGLDAPPIAHVNRDIGGVVKAPDELKHAAARHCECASHGGPSPSVSHSELDLASTAANQGGLHGAVDNFALGRRPGGARAGANLGAAVRSIERPDSAPHTVSTTPHPFVESEQPSIPLPSAPPEPVPQGKDYPPLSLQQPHNDSRLANSSTASSSHVVARLPATSLNAQAELDLDAAAVAAAATACSLTEQIFGGILSSTCTCSACGAHSMVREPCSDISLPIPEALLSKCDQDSIRLQRNMMEHKHQLQQQRQQRPVSLQVSKQHTQQKQQTRAPRLGAIHANTNGGATAAGAAARDVSTSTSTMSAATATATAAQPPALALAADPITKAEMKEKPLTVCVRQFFKPEPVPDYRCAKCNKKSTALKQYALLHPPEVLILHLKRFAQARFGAKKLSCRLSIPPTIDFTPFCHPSADWARKTTPMALSSSRLLEQDNIDQDQHPQQQQQQQLHSAPAPVPARVSNESQSVFAAASANGRDTSDGCTAVVSVVGAAQETQVGSNDVGLSEQRNTSPPLKVNCTGAVTASGTSSLTAGVAHAGVRSAADSVSASGSDAETSSPAAAALMYRLLGIVCHGGSLSGGHYSAYVHARLPGGPSASDAGEISSDFDSNIKRKWFYISDSRYREATESEVRQREAYILFYERERTRAEHARGYDRQAGR